MLITWWWFYSFLFLVGARANTNTEEGDRAKPGGKAVEPAQLSGSPASAPFFFSHPKPSPTSKVPHTLPEKSMVLCFDLFVWLMCGTERCQRLIKNNKNSNSKLPWMKVFSVVMEMTRRKGRWAIWLVGCGKETWGR